MRIVIDADGCPVVDLTVKAAKDRDIPCLIVCDTAHSFSRDGAETIIVSKGADSADFKIANLVSSQDLVVTHDYGLAAMCLARGSAVIHPNGFLYTQENIDAMLFERHQSKKLRAARVRMKATPRRTKEQDRTFEEKLLSLLSTLK